MRSGFPRTDQADPLSLRLGDRLKSAALTRPGAIAASLLLFFFLYRAILWWKLTFVPMPPRGFVARRYGLHEYIGASGWDILAVAALCAPLFAFAILKRPDASRSRRPLFGAALLILVAFLSGVHLRMIFDRGEPLGVAAFHELSTGALTVREVLGYITAFDLALVASPLAFLWVIESLIPRLTEKQMRGALLAFGVFALFTLLSAFGHHHRGFPKSLHHNPLQYAAGELLRGLAAGPSQLKNKARPLSMTQGSHMRLSDPRLVAASERTVIPVDSSLAGEKGWNVVWIVMESTGYRYIDAKTPGGTLVMPHLNELRADAWDMRRHYSTANSSHRSLFSLFSGLYPSFGPAIFCITPRVAVPTIRDLLPPEYETFLYTPAQLQSYFPLAMMLNSGFTEIKGETDLRPPNPRPSRGYALNELDAAEAFARRLSVAREPFLGVYYSYAPHYYYKDYGPEFRVLPDEKNAYHRYLNNLRVLDTALKVITRSLKERGLWERTIFMLVGDHGEAFGQHGFSTHANDSHDEQVHVPWIMRIPGNAPRAISEVTSHVDVVPTLLSVLDIEFDRSQLQGESLFDNTSERRYVFFIGNEETANSVSREGIKVQHIYRGDGCRAYDLARDPLEKTAVPCTDYPEQDQTLSDFAAHQIRALAEYNRRQLKARAQKREKTRGSAERLGSGKLQN